MRARLMSGVLGCVLVMLVLLLPTPAVAQGWGRPWFEQWSGPGGFTGHEVSITPVCELDSGDRGQGDIVWLGKSSRERNTRWCLDVSFAFLENHEEDQPSHGEVSFNLYQATAMASPFENGALELGAGAGLADFEGDRFDSFTRFYVPTKFAFKPFRLGRLGREVGWTGIIQLVGNLHVFPKAIRDEDVNFTEHSFDHHFQGNLILFFDFSSLLFRR
jgi:hypothetical protein